MADRAAELRQAAETTDRAKSLREAAEGPSFLGDLGQGAKAAGYNMAGILAEGMTGQRPEPMEVPDSMAGRIGQVGTESLAAGIGIGGALTRVNRAQQGASRAREVVQNVLSDIGVSFRTRPIRFGATEAGLGGLAGAGGYLAEQMHPDSEAARFVGEVLGGSAPALARGATKATAKGIEMGVNALPISGPIYRGAQRTYQGARDMMNPTTSRIRAEQRVARATDDPEGALQRMDEELLPGLTPAARSGDEGLMRLETSVDKELDDADKFIERSMNEVQENIQAAMREFSGSPEATAETYEQAQQSLRDALDQRIQQAARRTEQTLESISPNASREVVNETASNELRAALGEMRRRESDLYDLIPENAVAPTNNVKNSYREFKSSLSEAQVDDMPAVAKRLLEGNNKKWGATTTIKELRGLQSALRQEARNARAGDSANFNKARIADQLADSITDDIANAEGGEAVSGAVETAVSFSRDMNQRFRQGAVGDLLGYGRAGDVRTPPGLVLENSIGVTGPRGREAFDDIMKATDRPAVKDAMEDFIRNKFFDVAVRDGQINRSAAQSFLRSNKEILSRMPLIGMEIDGAIKSMDITDLRRARQRNIERGLRPSVNKATMFIERSPERAFESVLSSRDPSGEMINLLNMSRRDATGEAEQGLKAAFSDFIAKKSSDRLGNVSGQRMELFLEDPKTKKAMMSLFTGPEINRWNVIKNTAKRLDQQRGSGASGEGVLGDAPGRASTVLARLLGAASGTRIARLTGAGGIQSEAIMSQTYKNLLDKGIDPARRLIMDAVQDETLFREVLLSETSPDGRVPEQARRRLNAWIASLGIDTDEEDE